MESLSMSQECIVLQRVPQTETQGEFIHRRNVAVLPEAGEFDVVVKPEEIRKEHIALLVPAVRV
jgi:protein subunit release factor A